MKGMQGVWGEKGGGELSFLAAGGHPIEGILPEGGGIGGYPALIGEGTEGGGSPKTIASKFLLEEGYERERQLWKKKKGTRQERVCRSGPLIVWGSVQQATMQWNKGGEPQKVRFPPSNSVNGNSPGKPLRAGGEGRCTRG